jgi:hypothetical protein
MRQNDFYNTTEIAFSCYVSISCFYVQLFDLFYVIVKISLLLPTALLVCCVPHISYLGASYGCVVNVLTSFTNSVYCGV